MKVNRNMIEETMHYIMTEHFKGVLDPEHKYFEPLPVLTEITRGVQQ